MKYKNRYFLIVISLLLVISGLLWRVIKLQVFEQEFLRNQGDLRTIRLVNTPAYRGMILDRNGEPLAISTPVSSVWLNPKEFDLNHPQSLTLAGILDISLDDLLNKVTQHKERGFVYLKRHVTPDVAEKVKVLAISGVYLKSEYRRYYPAGEVSAHVVGLTNIDDEGKEGLELAFDSWLRGFTGSKKVVKDRRGREVQILEGLKETQSGQNLILSLDQRLQYLAYRELKSAVVNSGAAAGSVVVLDVQTGEVLAMVNQPSFNPNARLKLRLDERYCNRAVVHKLEPGSVAKTFSVVNALQSGQITPTTLVDTSPGWVKVGKHLVREDKNKNFGKINVASVLARSSNVGITKLALSLPPETLFETYSKFGFGKTTESGFPGESAGTLVNPPKQGSFVLATMAFGYGMSVTPIQLARAYAALGAGGILRPVTFLKQADIPKGEQVIDPVVARQVVDILAGVVERGSAANAKVVGYYTAGKTGTTRKVSEEGGYDADRHVAVFAGLAPASHPRFAIVVVVDDPKTDVYYGGQLAAPLFSKIAAGALRLFNVPPDMIDNKNLRVAQANGNTSQSP